MQQARRLLKGKPVPPGTWWQLPVDPAASKAAQRQCFTLPLFFFTAPGQAPPTPPVPLGTLAAYAYNHMTIPAPTLTVNPARRGYVNLATYVLGPDPAGERDHGPSRRLRGDRHAGRRNRERVGAARREGGVLGRRERARDAVLGVRP